MNQIYPKYLYHYTTIETLALILESGKMRFSSLDIVDDLEEKFAGNIKNAGKYCFVACFTEDEEESIPIWSLYSRNGKGIRIKLKSNAFKDEEYHINHGKISASVRMKITEEGLIGTSIANDFALIKIEYTNDNSLLFPSFDFKPEKSVHLEIISKFGRYKNSYWAFQKEWRYIKFALPSDKSRILLNKDVDAKFLDIKIEKEVLNNMEITLGYNIGLGNKIIVEQLIKTYNDKNSSNIKIYSSILTNKVR